MLKHLCVCFVPLSASLWWLFTRSYPETLDPSSLRDTLVCAGGMYAICLSLGLRRGPRDLFRICRGLMYAGTMTTLYIPTFVFLTHETFLPVVAVGGVFAFIVMSFVVFLIYFWEQILRADVDRIYGLH